MPFIPSPSTIRVIAEFQVGGSFVEISIAVKSTGATPTPAELAAAAGVMDSWVHATLLPLLSTNLTYQQSTAIDLSSATGGTATNVAHAGETGALNVAALPNNVTMAVTKRTALRGRSYRGRAYVPGLASTQQLDPTHLTTTATNNLNGAFATLDSDFNAVTLIPSVLSLFNGGAPRAAGVLTPITGYTTDNKLDSQRRRLAGRGI